MQGTLCIASKLVDMRQAIRGFLFKGFGENYFCLFVITVIRCLHFSTSYLVFRDGCWKQ